MLYKAKPVHRRPGNRESERLHHNGMALVSAGKYLSGDDKHLAFINSPYRIEITEVSNRQYQKFLNAANRSENPKQYAHPHEPRKHSYQPKYWREYRSTLFINSPAGKVAPFDSETFKQPNNPVVGVTGGMRMPIANGPKNACLRRWSGRKLPGEKMAGYGPGVTSGITPRQIPEVTSGARLMGSSTPRQLFLLAVARQVMVC